MKRVSNKLKILIGVLILLLIIVWLLQLQFLREILKLMLLSFIVAYTLKPVHEKLVERGINGKLSAIFIILCFFGLVGSFFVFLIPIVIKEGSNINATINEIQNFAKGLYKETKILSENSIINSFIKSLYIKGNAGIDNIFNNLIDSLMTLGEDALTYFIIPIITYYFLSDKENLINKITMLFPYGKRRIIKKVSSDIDKILSRYIISQFMLCILIGVLTYIVLRFMNVKFPALLAALNGLFNIIPYFGPIFGGIPAILVALLTSSKTALWTAIWLYAIQQLEGNIISPKVIGETVSMHPLLVIILLIIGGKIGGFLGMVLAIPLGVVVKVIYEDINYYLF